MIGNILKSAGVSNCIQWGLVLLVASMVMGCQRADKLALEKGREAEACGELAEAKRLYAEAIALGNGEGFQRMATLLLQLDRAELFKKDVSLWDEQWIAKVPSIVLRANRFAKEAEKRGCPTEELQGQITTFENDIQLVRDTLMRASGQAQESAPAEKITDEAGGALREALEQKERVEKDIVLIRKEVDELERQLAESEQELKETRASTAKDLADLDKIVANGGEGAVFALAMMYGSDQYALQEAAFRVGAEAGVRSGWHKDVDSAKDKALSGRRDRFSARLAARKSELAEWEQMLEDCQAEIERLQRETGT